MRTVLCWHSVSAVCKKIFIAYDSSPIIVLFTVTLLSFKPKPLVLLQKSLQKQMFFVLHFEVLLTKMNPERYDA